MRRLRVGVIGLGVGEQHARAYLAIDQCELSWLYDLNLKKAQALVDKLGTGSVATSFAQIIQDPTVDVVSIASYDATHFEQVVAALEAGKHVFVEKPLCRTMDELRVIKQVWSKNGGKLKLSSNLILRAAPVYGWLKQSIDAGEFGQIYAFDGDYLYGRLQKITQGWRKDEEDYSVTLGGGIHLIDLMVWFTGERPLSVYARGNRISTQGTDFRYHDYVAATLSYPSGLVGRITANFGCVHRHQHVLRVFGTKATFINDDAGPRLHMTRDPATMASAITLPTLPESKGSLIPSFVSAILNDQNLEAHAQEIFDVISICVACEEALKSNSEVEVQYV